MPAKKKAVRARTKAFRLVPTAATRNLLKGLDVSVDFDGAAIVIRVPRGGGCLGFSPPCVAARFFKKVPLR